MRLLPDARLYSDTEHCLAFLRSLPAAPDETPREREPVHVYWRGGVSRKQAFTVKSFLATQDPEAFDLWVWLAPGTDAAALEPFRRYIRIRSFDPAVEAAGTPLEAWFDGGLTPTRVSNVVRLVLLHRYGGIWADFDVAFLRDLRALVADERFAGEFCYAWSSGLPYANNALLRLERGSTTSAALLERAAAVGSARPRDLFRYDVCADLDLTVLPCIFFDPLWLHYDGRDSYAGAPFHRWDGFFRRFGWRFRRREEIESYRDFFPGAFAYHWHNVWDARERAESYFGLLEGNFEELLGAKPS